MTKNSAYQKASAFIQNIHHFRYECRGTDRAPIEQVVIFDEAQRAWNREKLDVFMRERNRPPLDMSEPEFLLSAMDRHSDWCVVLCLVGNGQEINTGEGGIGEWFTALRDHYPDWRIQYSPRFATDLGEKEVLRTLPTEALVTPELHLGVSVRSFRAERVAEFVAAVMKGDQERAADCSPSLSRYPVAISRNLPRARAWLRDHARGTERYGLVASSNALRLKPLGLHMKAKVDAANWFLNDSDDVRSSLALEDAASEFEVQGLELDWVGVCWDANLRYEDGAWAHYKFLAQGGPLWEPNTERCI